MAANKKAPAAENPAPAAPAEPPQAAARPAADLPADAPGVIPKGETLSQPAEHAAAVGIVGSPHEAVPGSGVLGRGIHIRPHQPYELKGLLFSHEGAGRLHRIPSVEATYAVPAGCEINDSPPIPADLAIGQTIIEESWNRFAREMTISAQAAAHASAFSIDASGVQGSSLKAEEDSYYALRNSFVPFWSVYMPVTDRRSVIAEFKAIESAQDPSLIIPDGRYDLAHRSAYARIFDRFGTHFIKSAWLGGRATLAMVVTKSSNLSKEEVKAGIELAFAGVAKGGVSRARSETHDQVRNNSSCNVFGSGGDPTLLAKLTALQPEQYDEWLDSVKRNPEIIELGVAGIWTLLEDETRAEALRQAYIEETTFTPLVATVPFFDWLIIIKKDEVFDFAMTSKYGASRVNLLSRLFLPHAIRQPEQLRERLMQILDGVDDPSGPSRLAAAAKCTMPFNPTLTLDFAKTPLKDVPAGDLPVYLTGLLNDVLLNGDSRTAELLWEALLKGSRLAPPPRPSEGVAARRLLLDERFSKRELPAWPARRTLATYLPMLQEHPEFIKPHAAISLYWCGERLAKTICLFHWRQCLLIDLEKGRVVDGYPKDIAEDWPEVDFDRIDAAVTVSNRLYFFRGDEYIRLDYKSDSTYEHKTRDRVRTRFPGVDFDKIDTAAYWGSNKICFFSGDQYIRYDFSSHRADPGYPRQLTSNYIEAWDAFE